MTTYEHGRAPADAPVTWQRTTTPGIARVMMPSGINPYIFISDAEIICQWAHLAALADEAATKDNEIGLPACGSDWLRRYRAAKGEA